MDIMHKSTFTDSSSQSTLNSDLTTKGPEDNCNAMEINFNADPKDIKNDILTLNKKDNKAIQKSGCHDCNLTAKLTHKCPFEPYLEKCTRLQKENLEVKKKLKKMEKYSKDCATELQRFVKRFKEFKSINKNLDSKNKQLLNKNQQMRQRITEVLNQNKPQSEHLERITQSKQLEKQQLIEAAVKNDLEELPMKEDSARIKERKILTQLQQENLILQEKLEQKCQVMKYAVSKAERVQTELDEVESCLLTLQTERNLLRQEVKRLHEEYICLTNSISLQMKRNSNGFGKSFTVYNSKVHLLSVLKEDTQHNG
ncbi:coiled-coil domain-containing protein 110 [Danio rerio]|uniref:Coiled-coil domain-containing protein 110 n=3 Tax=Danio rerio TaxID=7955 RepID=B8JIG5_DANRE|nr:gamma-taxilin [Danio rerio]|eukprot:XP_017211369.2 gamma-taxilin [Danio rerio]